VLWRRQLGTYPNTGARVFDLAITVLATITLYYETPWWRPNSRSSARPAAHPSQRHPGGSGVSAVRPEHRGGR